MKRLVPVALSVVLLAACGGGSSGKSGPDLAGCEKAMRAQFAAALDSGATGSRPPECHDVSDAQLQEIAGKILGEQVGG